MKRYFLIIISLLFISIAHAQQIDSIAFNGGYLFFHLYGKGKPVIILTGGPGISYQQQEEVAIRVGQSYQAILVEQRGTGRSMPAKLNKESLNMELAANDLNLILDHLHLKEATVYGHSYGSFLAMYYGAKYPNRVSQLILTGPAPFNGTGDQMATYGDNKEARMGLLDTKALNELDEKAAKGTITKDDEALFRKFSNGTLLYDKSKFDQTFARVATGKINTTTMNLMMSSVNKIDLTEAVKKFRKPITIICGRQDPLAFMAYEYQLINPSVKVHWIARAGHFAMFEQEELFYKALFETLGQTK
ncbi:alpha/beta fold hydrolase [Pedobacter sp. ASV12]|uniref:alpha/beta fold hydrolase n=1 Tax=Pedobacter sp. ASV12 TaxID=2795120 RepID=UPI0018EA44CB|nr:alpha/beta hydrolase [Pedobacter sp. ASV12]